MVRWHGGNDGLEQLQNLPALEWLDLEHTEITDSGLAKVGLLTHLKALKLGHTRITDRGMPYLRRCAAWRDCPWPAQRSAPGVGTAQVDAASALAELNLDQDRQ